MIGASRREEADALDSVLVVVFLLGLYLEYSPKLAAGVPFPVAPAGIAGLIMLARHYRRIRERHLGALLAVISVYLASILAVPETLFLKERLKGFVQIAYSFVIGYGLFLTMLGYERDRLARLFLGFCLVVLIGCALETHTGFRAVSDAVRERLFDQHLYSSTARDRELYGGIRPKFFSSEPSYVGFALTLYAFAWYVLSTRPGKLLWYFAILGAGVLLVRSPTLVLGCLLVLPYEMFLAGRNVFAPFAGGGMRALRVFMVVIAGVGAVAAASQHFFSARVQQITRGNDPSYFYRVTGPVLVAGDTIERHPIAGAGLTGEERIADRIRRIYRASPAFSPRWRIDEASTVITNYFWHHWIYLGLIWGVAALFAVTWFLRTLGPPSLLFCWAVWAVMGQASGAYVSPKPWATLLIACAIALLHYRQPGRLVALRRPAPFAWQRRSEAPA